MKRGPKSILTPHLQQHICESLEKCNTIKTAMQSAGVSERVFYDWMKNNPAFAAAVFRARARAKAKLVRVITDAAPNDWRAAAWLLERSWADEYSRVTVERVEPFEETNKSKPGVTILYRLGNQTLRELTDFPNMETDSPEVAREKQRRLLGQTTEAQEEIVEASEETISDTPPPQAVPKALTGRIRPEWRNGK